LNIKNIKSITKLIFLITINNTSLLPFDIINVLFILNILRCIYRHIKKIHERVLLIMLHYSGKLHYIKICTSFFSFSPISFVFTKVSRKIYNKCNNPNFSYNIYLSSI